MVLHTQTGFFIGPLFIYYYGIVYALTALTLYLLLSRKREKIGITQIQVDEFMIAILLGLMVGGRIFHFLINDPSVFFSNPIELFRVRDGGMSFFGALIGMLTGSWIWYRRQIKHVKENAHERKLLLQKFISILDLTSLVVCVALIFGRLANFLNQELVGRIADPSVVPWCVNFATATGCRHPYQLYAAASHLLLAIVLLVLYLRNSRIGTVFFTFLTGYGILRFITDFWREDPIVAIGLTSWQFFAIALAIVGGFLLVRHLRHDKTNKSNSSKRKD